MSRAVHKKSPIRAARGANQEAGLPGGGETGARPGQRDAGKGGAPFGSQPRATRAPRLPVTLVLSLLVLWSCSGFVPSQPAPRPPASQWSLERIAIDHARGAPPSTYEFSEGEINSFLTARVRDSRKPGLESVRISLKDENLVETHLVVDMDELGLETDSVSLWLVSGLLQGRQEVALEGRLEASQGQATYEITSASMNGVSIPVTVANLVLRSLGSRLDPPLDPGTPSPLPYGIEWIRCSQDTLRIHRGE